MRKDYKGETHGNGRRLVAISLAAILGLATLTPTAYAQNTSGPSLRLDGPWKWGVMASMSSLEGAIAFARDFKNLEPSVVRTVNGRFAVIFGPERVDDAEQAKQTLHAHFHLPNDFYFSRGDRFVETVWATPEADPDFWTDAPRTGKQDQGASTHAGPVNTGVPSSSVTPVPVVTSANQGGRDRFRSAFVKAMEPCDAIWAVITPMIGQYTRGEATSVQLYEMTRKTKDVCWVSVKAFMDLKPPSDAAEADRRHMKDAADAMQLGMTYRQRAAEKLGKLLNNPTPAAFSEVMEDAKQSISFIELSKQELAKVRGMLTGG